MQLRMAEWETPIRRHRDVCAFLPGLSAFKAPELRTALSPLPGSLRALRRVPPASGDAGGHEGAITPGARALTGLTLVWMGGLLWLAFQNHVWARDFVQAMWPLFIVIVGVSTVAIVTDGDTAAGKVALVAGVAIVFLAQFGIVPEATLQILGPWALALVGVAIALSGLGHRARPAAERTASRTEAGRRGMAQAHPHAARLPNGLVHDTPEYQRAKAS